MKEMMKWFKEEESGQGMVEYALILALISIAAIAVLNVLGPAVADKLKEVNTALGGKAPAPATTPTTPAS
ncbi:MAG: Flp family type IVb pilin [Lachnospiraceae bacterium]